MSKAPLRTYDENLVLRSNVSAWSQQESGAWLSRLSQKLRYSFTFAPACIHPQPAHPSHAQATENEAAEFRRAAKQRNDECPCDTRGATQPGACFCAKHMQHGHARSLGKATTPSCFSFPASDKTVELQPTSQLTPPAASARHIAHSDAWNSSYEVDANRLVQNDKCHASHASFTYVAAASAAAEYG